MENNVIKKGRMILTRREWNDSYDKWSGILTNIKARRPLAIDGRGRCGYCTATTRYGIRNVTCEVCALNAFCSSKSADNAFWFYEQTTEELARLLRDPYRTGEESDVQKLWFEAEVLAGIILMAIIDDGRSLGHFL